MITVITLIGALLLLSAAALLAIVRWRTADVLNFVRRIAGLGASIHLANAITAVNITPKGRATYLADATFTSRYLLCKIGSDVNHIAICTASDVPLGVVDDMNPSTDPTTDLSYWLPVDLLGMCEDTKRVQASAAITLGAFVSAAAAGQVAAGAASGVGYVCGRAKTAAAAGNDIIEMIPCFPIKVGSSFPY